MNTLTLTARTALLATGISVIALSGAYAAPELPDDTYVTLNGTVSKILSADEFQLDYSGGNIVVDTNDQWNNLFTAGNPEQLKIGDRVTVSGQVDDNLFTKKELEANAISYRGTNYSRYYWQTPADTTDTYSYYTPYDLYLDEDTAVRLNGYVSQVTGSDFMLDYGPGNIKVETDGLTFTDSTRLTVGDRVTVYGDVDDDWYDQKEVDAEYIVRSNIYTEPSS